MRAFLASDVLFARARGEIVSVLSRGGRSGDALIDESVFLRQPDEPWLDPLQLGGDPERVRERRRGDRAASTASLC